VTPEQHYSVGLQFLATAESANTPADLVNPNCMIAQTHFLAATASTAMRMAAQVTAQEGVVAVQVSTVLLESMIGQWSPAVQIKIEESASSPTGYEMTLQTVTVADPSQA
jgi:hypothetical protein